MNHLSQVFHYESSNFASSAVMPSLVNNAALSDSALESLEKNLSERQKKIIDFLDKIEAGDAKKIYKTMLFLQSHPDLPAIELVLSHCLSEFVNALLRRDENERKDILKKAITDMDFYGCDEEKIKQATSDAFAKIKEKLSDELSKIKSFVKDYLEVKYQENVTTTLAKNIKDSKESANKSRHYNGELTGNIDRINSTINKVEDALFILSTNYFDKLRVLNKILQDANLYPLKRPSDDAIKNISLFLTKENEIYFFNNLENHEWASLLKDILKPDTKNLEPNYPWPQGIYLSKIANKEPTEVFNIIKPYLEERLAKNIDVGHFVLMRIFKISENFPKNKEEYSKKVGEAYLSYLKHDKDLEVLVNSHYVKDFLKDLTIKDNEDLVLQIIEKLLAMEPNKEDPKFKDFKTRFNDSANMEDYHYEEVLEVVKNSFSINKSFKLFETLCKILKNAVDGKFAKESNQHLCNRSAIEDHSQDQYKNASEFKLITAIRDIAERIFENDFKNELKVIEVLRASIIPCQFKS